jgi:SAM-dependent methyltransferase
MAEVVPDADHVAHVYGDDYFEGGSAGYPDYLSESEILTSQGHRYAELMSRYLEAGTVLDVGAAAGFKLKGFVEKGWRGEGVEPNAKMADYARTQLHLTVRTGTLETFSSNTKFDLVSMIQVVSHFLDPRSAFKAAQAVTKPGGFWLIETWNRESLTARIFRKHWHEYSPPSVLHWFSPDGLRQLAAEFGFREVSQGRPGKWISAKHAKSLVGYRMEATALARPFSGLMRLVPDRMGIPYPAEDLFWMIFQGS